MKSKIEGRTDNVSNDDPIYKCTVCGRPVGSAKCCNDRSTVPLNHKAIMESLSVGTETSCGATERQKMREEESRELCGRMMQHADLEHEARMSVIVEQQEMNLFNMLNPKISQDGDQFCVLHGEDLQSGIAGFGDTIRLAIYNFNKQFDKKAKTMTQNTKEIKPITSSAIVQCFCADCRLNDSCQFKSGKNPYGCSVYYTSPVTQDERK